MLSALVGRRLLLVIAAQAMASPTHASDGGDPQTTLAPCRVDGGGCLNVSGGVGHHVHATCGGVVADQRGSVDLTQSTWEHVYRDGHTILVSFHSLDAHVVQCLPEPRGSCPPPDGARRADIEGTGKVVLGNDGIEVDANIQASIVDVGTCGGSEHDFYSITIRRGLAIGQGEVVHELSGTLDCGNLKVDAPWRGSDREAGASPHMTESEGR
jgi:hypothetical protein